MFIKRELQGFDFSLRSLDKSFSGAFLNVEMPFLFVRVIDLRGQIFFPAIFSSESISETRLFSFAQSFILDISLLDMKTHKYLIVWFFLISIIISFVPLKASRLLFYKSSSISNHELDVE